MSLQVVEKPCRVRKDRECVADPKTEVKTPSGKILAKCVPCGCAFEVMPS